MGSVYRAQRVDGLFEQTVAIKFVRQARGLENLQPLIEAERKTLARMDHPGIARILDGGTTEQGLQYLIMEFVRGVPLNQFLLG
ncbi:protein kinase, partial [Staphylococcus aureus]